MASEYSGTPVRYYLTVSAVLFSAGGFLAGMSFYTYGFVSIALGVVFVLFSYRSFQKTNQSLSVFFDSIRNNDTSFSFPVTGTGKSLDNLHRSLNGMNQYIREVKLAAEAREKYYKTMIRQSATGFVVINGNGKIELLNEKACELAGISRYTTHPEMLKIKNPSLYEALCSLKPGEKTTYKNHRNFSVQQLLLKASGINAAGGNLVLCSIEDIRPELSEKEVESYQRLISILTHEIMNAIAPLTSVAKSISKFLTLNNPDEAQKTAALIGLKAIEDQTEGLLRFVGTYRQLVKIPVPVMQEIDIEEWADQIRMLFGGICTEKGIIFDVNCHHRVKSWKGDKNLLNQVLLNLFRNAVDALEEKQAERRIRIEFSGEGEQLVIRVGNNGPAIPADIEEKIFVPFFTTKPQGSGIGLSLSRQIVLLHRGTLEVFSDQETGTIFTIRI